MATYVLNIGTDRSHVGKPPLTDVEVIEAVCTWLGQHPDRASPAKIEFHQSDSERTAVVSFEVAFHFYADDYEPLIAALEQECIAERAQSTRHPNFFMHELVGPKAEAWGLFDPTRFIMPGGTRLEEPKAKGPLTFHEIKEGLAAPEATDPRAVEAFCQPVLAAKPFFRLLDANGDLIAERMGEAVLIRDSNFMLDQSITLSRDVFEQIIAAYEATK